jgi:hypothetical protein
VTRVAADAALSVFAGVNPGSLVESRAFLDFPLASLPANAHLAAATLYFGVDSVLPFTGSIPIRIDLVSLAPPLLGIDFNQSLPAPQESTVIEPPITSADVNTRVRVDVTALFAVAQAAGYGNFQIRISEVSGTLLSGATTPELMEINERTEATAPLLVVDFF